MPSYKYYVGDRGLFRKKLFETPQQLWEAFCEYVDWARANPWKKSEAIKSGDCSGDIIEVPIERPLTIGGFCVFAGIGTATFHDYGHKEGYKEYSNVCRQIEEVTRTQKFEGAAVGTYNANIIARDLGLREKTESEINANVSSTIKITVDDSDCNI